LGLCSNHIKFWLGWAGVGLGVSLGFGFVLLLAFFFNLQENKTVADGRKKE
jgi:hypothetical protein